MPHDTMSPEFSLDGVDEILAQGSGTKSGGIRSAFRAASDAFLKPVKHAERKAIATAAIIAAIALCTPRTARAQAFSVLYNFCSVSGCTDGEQPNSNLVQDSSGNLYGTASHGGANRSSGTLFKLGTNGSYSVLYNFCVASYCTDGGNPGGNLIQSASGVLYGTAGWGQYGGGIILASGTSGGYSVFYNFCQKFNCADGADPNSLIQDKTGNFYGTGFGGGPSGGGIVYKLDANANYSIVYPFCSLTNCTDGFYPQVGLVQDTSGNLYGATTYGGDVKCAGNGCGTVFEIGNSGGETVLHAFTGGTDGIEPLAGPVEDCSGNFYGTTSSSGVHGAGTAYKIAGGQETLLYSFGSVSGDGIQPRTGLVLDSAGNLYGTTYYGGANSQGTVFKIDATTGAETVLHSFTASTDGTNPTAGLIIGADGTLYGTTFRGGLYSGGTVFEISGATAGPPAQCSGLTLSVAPNDECKSDWGKCSANVVLADGVETTDLTAIVKPPQSVDVLLSTTFGGVSDAHTDSQGKGNATYTAGSLTLGDTKTSVGTVSGSIGSQQFPSLTEVFNYRGFQFHRSQVTDVQFTDSSAMTADQIEMFFENPKYDSFLAKFYLIGGKGGGGFFDANGDGKLDVGDTAYVPGKEQVCETFPCLGFKEGTTGSLASTVFATVSVTNGINPQVLLATEEKEAEALITSKTFPLADGLDLAFGCPSEPTDFYSQIVCAAHTLGMWFNGDKKDKYFFPVTGGPCFGDEQRDRCLWVSSLKRLKNVGFEVFTAATYAQYKYTPFIETKRLGGVYSFELNWRKFHF